MTKEQAQYRLSLPSFGVDAKAKEYIDSVRHFDEPRNKLAKFYYDNLPDNYEKASVSSNNNSFFLDSDECVYLIYNPMTHLYKIGISKDPFRRIEDLSRACGVNLVFVIFIQMEANYDETAYICEQIFHKYYKEFRQRGEWFKLNGNQISELYSVMMSDVCGADMYDNYENYIKICHESNGLDHYIGCSTPIVFRKYDSYIQCDIN